MVNYQNGKVYKIINENNEIIYIGSTAEEKLCKRYAKHYLKAPNNKIILIENYPCNSKEELLMREQQIIEDHSNLLNKIRAYISEEDKKEYKIEYYKNNKDETLEKQKEYYKNNKDIISEKHKEYYEENRTEILEYQKEYYKNYKNEKLEYKKEYYENNKNQILKKVKCEYCNCEITKNHLKRHQKSQKCLKIQNQI